MKNKRTIHRISRHIRVRSKVSGTEERPRMAVYRSNQGLYVQIINDVTGKTLVGIRSDKKNVEAAKELGMEIAEQAKKLNIGSIVFDRGGYMYHGAVKALADAARAGGLTF